MQWNQKLTLSVEEVIAATGWDRTRLYRKFNNGDLPSIKDGRRRMVSRRALEEHIANLERESAGRAA